MREIYRSLGARQPLILTPRGTWANHHILPNGDIGARVTADEATHFSRWDFVLEERS